MQPIKDAILITNSKIADTTSTIWFYLSVEFLIGALLAGIVSILGTIKSFLPKPPRDLTGNVALIVGVSTTLGETLAEEFAKSGCSVICMDENLDAIKKLATRLQSRYPSVEQIGTRYNKQRNENDDSDDDDDGENHAAARSRGSRIVAYSCDLSSHNEIRDTARRVKAEIGGIDILVTCVGTAGQDIFDTASTTLMCHYWTILAFLPLMMHAEKPYVVGVTPVASHQDAYLGSRVAIAGLMESLGHELANGGSHFTFFAVAPSAERRLMREDEQRVAKGIVQAMKRNQSCLAPSWSSRFLYWISCFIYNGITTITRWIYAQGCDDAY